MVGVASPKAKPPIAEPTEAAVFGSASVGSIVEMTPKVVRDADVADFLD